MGQAMPLTSSVSAMHGGIDEQSIEYISLDERIAAAFSSGATSDGVAELIGEAEATALSAGQEVMFDKDPLCMVFESVAR